jgi:uncharacterized 2Fe-2S/4Fe-4S cluster protein (DUF4445 family)
MWAEEGAIESIVFTKEGVICTVVGDGNPRGLCGSGLVELMSELYVWGLVDQSGRFATAETIGPPWSERILAEQQGFLIARSSDGNPIILTQRDVREFQLAKAAINSGITILLEESGITHEAVAEVLLAGSFGYHVNTASAEQIGLLPRFPNAKLRVVGNAAHQGAVQVLLSRDYLQQVEEIGQRVRSIELANSPQFQEVLVGSLLFPESRGQK